MKSTRKILKEEQILLLKKLERGSCIDNQEGFATATARISEELFKRDLLAVGVVAAVMYFFCRCFVHRK